MSDAGASNEPGDELQFQTAELAPSTDAAQPTVQRCPQCTSPIVDAYYAMGDKVICPTCRDRLIAQPQGSKFGRLAKAFFLGLAAGLAGAVVWFAIRRITGYEIGLVAIFVGLAVGAAVRKGSGNRGGRGYQIIAVLLTYCCIAANYMPDIFEGVQQAAMKERAAKAEVEKAAPRGGHSIAWNLVRH
jgi:hypothetical protein